MHKIHKVLTIGYSAEGYGFGRVIQSLFSHLGELYEIYHIELGNADKSPWQHSIYRIEAFDRLGICLLTKLVSQIEPQIIFALVEPWNAKEYINSLNDCYKNRIVIYSPVDGEINCPDCLESINKVGRLIVYNQYGNDVIVRAFDSLRQLKHDIAFPKISQLPHGVDHNKFYPLFDRESEPQKLLNLRQGLFGESDKLNNAFIFLNANRNTSRKAINLTIEGFQIFSQGKPENVKLCLHMGIKDRGCNVWGLARKFGITDRLLTTVGKQMTAPECSDERLNMIFNACDVGVNTSGGEGWGLVSFEHAATGAPQILPEHTACKELWHDSAILIPATTQVNRPHFHTELQFTSPQDVASAFETIYFDNALRKRLGKAAYSNALKYQWQNIALELNSIFQDVINDNLCTK